MYMCEFVYLSFLALIKVLILQRDSPPGQHLLPSCQSCNQCIEMDTGSLLATITLAILTSHKCHAKLRENVVSYGTTTAPCWSRKEGRREYYYSRLEVYQIQKTFQLLQLLYNVRKNILFPVEKELFALQVSSRC